MMIKPARIAILAAAVTLPILTFAGVLVIQLDTRRQESVDRTLREAARVAMDAVDGELGWHQATLETLASSPGLRSQRVEIMMVPSRRVLEARPDWCGLAMLGPDGRRLMELRRRQGEMGQPITPPLGTDPPVPPEARQRAVTIGIHTPSRCEGMPALVVAAPVSSNANVETVQGDPSAERRILLASVDPVVFTAALQRLRLPQGWTVAVLDRNRVVAGRLPAPERFIGTHASAALEAALASPEDQLVRTVTQEGQEVYTAVFQSRQSGWAVAVAAPAALVDGPLQRERLVLVGGGLMALLLAGILAMSIGRLLAEQRESERRLVALEAERAQERRLSEVAANLPGVIFRRVQHPDGRISYPYVSAGAELDLGLDPAELAKPDHDRLVLTVVLPEDRPLWEAAMADSARCLKPYDVEGRVRRRDGSIAWIRSRANARRTPDGCIVWDGVAVDVTELKLAEEALRASEQKLRMALNAGNLVLWEVDVSTDRVTCGPDLPALFGLDPAVDWTAAAYTEAIHPDDREAVTGELERSLAGKSVFHAEFRVKLPDGRIRWISSYSAIRRNAAGTAELMIGANRDITAAKEAEARQQLLMREVDHRAKNVLTVVQALVRVTRADTAEAFAEAVEGRVAALARTHVLLARNHWEGAALRDLLRDELAPYVDPGLDLAVPERLAPEHLAPERFSVEGPDLEVEPDSTQAVGMVFHELATNAVKYGALSRAEGMVAVHWALDRQAGILRLTWRESGGPPVSPPVRSGFGSLLIETNVRTQLSGDVVMEWRPEGLICRIEIPADRINGRRRPADEA